MKAKNQFKKIAIFGYFGAGNLGDEAVVGVLLKKIREHYPGIEIIGICLNPDDTEKKHKIHAYPIRRLPEKNMVHDINVLPSMLKKILRRLFIILPKECMFLFHSYRLLKDVDAVIVGGSGQLVDNEGGPLNHPYNYYKWSWIARLAGVKFIFLSVGTGPVLTRTGKYLIKKSMQMAGYHSFRDDYSKNIAESLGVTKNNIVCPDMAFSINVKPARVMVKPGRSNIIVGIAPLAYMDPRHWPKVNPLQYKEYVMKMALFTAWLIETNHDVLFIHTQVNGDDLVIADIMESLVKNATVNIERHVSEYPVQWYTDVFEAITKTDFVVASRFHAVVFSYFMNRSLISLSYDPKIANVMESVGQSNFVLPIGSFTVPQLIEKFIALKAQSSEAKEKIQTKVHEFRDQLEEQYDDVFEKRRAV